MLRMIIKFTSLAVACWLAGSCVYVANRPESLPKDQMIECYSEQSDLIGTWQLAASCNWAWGDGCSPIPESERRNAYEFHKDGTCLRWVDDITTIELEYQLVYGEDWLHNRPDCLLKIGTSESQQTYALHFKGPDTLSLALLAYDAGSATYVRAY